MHGPAHTSLKANAAAALSSTALHQMLNRHAQHPQQHSVSQQQGPGQQQAVGSSIRAKAASTATASANDASMVDSLLKYKFYKQFGIDPQHVAPYREQWLEAALQLVPKAPPPMVTQVS
jgi:hypothetical protein